jgi:hypothetical protein
MCVEPNQARRCAVADLAGIKRGDARQLQLGLLDAQPLCALCHVALAQLRALLVLDGAEHAEGAVLACSGAQHKQSISKGVPCFSTQTIGCRPPVLAPQLLFFW